MSLNVSLSTIITAATVLSDVHNLSTTTITQMVNEGYAQLWDKLTDVPEGNYNVSITTFSTTSTTNFYNLPTNFYKNRGVDVQYSGNLYLALKPFVWKDRNLYLNTSTYPGFFGPFYRYQFINQQILLLPPPGQSNTIRLWYVPCITDLVNLTDTLDGVNGWEQYIINYVAMQMMINNNLDCSQIVQQQAGIEDKIARMAASRDQGEPTVVAAHSDEVSSPFLAATGVLGAPEGGWGS